MGNSHRRICCLVGILCSALSPGLSEARTTANQGKLQSVTVIDFINQNVQGVNARGIAEGVSGIFASKLYSDERNEGYCTLSAGDVLALDLHTEGHSTGIIKIRIYYETSKSNMSLDASLKLKKSSGSTSSIPLRLEYRERGTTDIFPLYDDEVTPAGAYYFELRPKQFLSLFRFLQKDFLCLQQVEVFWDI